jgi:ABC-type Zn uptake system ZnuABC Zn-binding protein ZnuA
LLDPLNGLKVARAIRSKLVELRPAKREYFNKRYASFARRLASALLGKGITEKYDPEKTLKLYELGGLATFLQSQGDEALLGGWVKRMAPYLEAKVVGDHNMWPYFAARFGLAIIGYMEPRPGIAPTTRHLSGLVGRMKDLKVSAILAVVYFDARHARFLSQKTEAKVLELAHQCGARPGTDDYLSMMEYNVKKFETTLGGKK